MHEKCVKQNKFFIYFERDIGGPFVSVWVSSCSRRYCSQNANSTDE